jgi:hypothetical protein
MKSISLLLILLLSVLAGSAQPSKFSRVFYDNAGSAQAFAIAATLDHGYVIAGEKDYKALALKMDSTGAIEWSRNIGWSTSDFYSVIATHDSCYMFTGYIENPGKTGTDIFCVKMDQDGDTVWTSAIELGNNDYAYSARETFDNGFILAGNSGDTKIALVKLNASGHLEWGKLFSGGLMFNIANAVAVAPDNGYVITGFSETLPPLGAGMFAMKTTPEGAVSWSKKQAFTTPNSSSGCDVTVIPGGYLWYFYSENEGTIVMKSDTSGNVIWSKNFNGFGINAPGEPMPKMHATSDGGFAIVYGPRFSPGGMRKFDIDGNLQWMQDLFLGAIDFATTPERGFMIVGNGPLLGVIMTSTQNPQIGIIKADSLGNGSGCTTQWSPFSQDYTINLTDFVFTPADAGYWSNIHPPVAMPVLASDTGCVAFSGGIPETIPVENPVTLCPNPSDGTFLVIMNGPQKIEKVEVFTITGAVIYSESGPASLCLPIDISFTPDGIYMVRIVAANKTWHERLILNR